MCVCVCEFEWVHVCSLQGEHRVFFLFFETKTLIYSTRLADQCAPVFTCLLSVLKLWDYRHICHTWLLCRFVLEIETKVLMLAWKVPIQPSLRAQECDSLRVSQNFSDTLSWAWIHSVAKNFSLFLSFCIPRNCYLKKIYNWQIRANNITLLIILN